MQQPKADPCSPSPCGPYADCRVIGSTGACSCQEGYIGRPPNCRPECVSNEECPSDKACQNQRCVNPCGSCGLNAECRVINHQPSCQCFAGYTGSPASTCYIMERATTPRPTERPRNPCEPSPCGLNAVCRVQNGAGACSCKPGYFGDPYHECKLECEENSHCDQTKACIQYKCKDPCPGTCGLYAECSVQRHIPVCKCPPGYQGNAFTRCAPIPPEPPKAIIRQNPCDPSPCGPYSQCREQNDQAICTYDFNFFLQW